MLHCSLSKYTITVPMFFSRALILEPHLSIVQLGLILFVCYCLIFACYGLKIAAMFKIGNSKDLPAIPDHLSDDGKDFVKQCLQRNPHHRPKATELLEHPFVKSATPLERPILVSEPTEPPSGVANGVKALVFSSSYFFLYLFIKVKFVTCHGI